MKLSLSEYSFDSVNWNKFLQFILLVAFLFGIKLWVIGKYGNATPYWDEWDAEAANLYKPYLSGELRFKDLISPHNEHRIFTTRILALIILKINILWNPVLQMVINACIHIIAILIAISYMAKVIGQNHLPGLMAFSLILFGIPYSWENTLSAFQSQFYFVLLFSLLSLWLLANKEPLTPAWWGGLICGIISFFSLASGVFTLGASALMSLIVFLSNRRRSSKQLSAVALLSILFIICIKLTPTIPGHTVLKVSSLNEFYKALVNILGWPLPGNFFSAIFRNLPSVIFFVLIIRKPPGPKDNKWFLVALIFWSVGQVFSLAYGRGAAPTIAPRYMDLFALMILLNFACLISIAQMTPKKRYYVSIIGIWTMIVISTLALDNIHHLGNDLEAKHAISVEEESNTRNYLATGDSSHLKNKQYLQIPYPDPDRLALILSWPEIRKILPPDISPGLQPKAIEIDPNESFTKNGYFPTTAGYANNSLGSFTMRGDTATGNITMKYDADVPAGKILIPVAGYPLNAGISLGIEQKGKWESVDVKSNPKESWSMAKSKVLSGQFAIKAMDSSKTTWLAIGNPVLVGRMDGVVNWLLMHYYIFIIGAVLIFVFLLMANGFKGITYETGNHHTKM
ncbi:MAG TPA: hypothetical protein VGQ09_07310 [Chitinophagaceae bacterium]|jgi:hypothetical protein|nr:hypothetical protein [Chitinophagaceae bacterium]